MKFRYLSFKTITPSEAFPLQKEILRPIIPIVLGYRNKKVRYPVLIDSGSDYCFFHKDIAEVLEIDWKKGKKLAFGGITGKKTIAYFCYLDLYIGGWEYKLYCGFSEVISPYGFGILGQYGFFDLFKIRFVLKKKEIEIIPY
jgi:hypothetical protein